MDSSSHRQESETCSPPSHHACLEANGPVDRLTRLAADLFQVSHAAIYRIVDGHLQLTSLTNSDDREPFDIEQYCMTLTDCDAPLILNDIGGCKGSNDALPDSRSGFFAGQPLRTPAGLPLGVLCIADGKPRRDFSTVQTATLDTLSGLAADLLQQRLSAENRRLSSVLFDRLGHDLRTPMNGILGMAELLLAGEDLTDNHRRRIEVIRRSGDTVLSMLESALDLAKFDTGEPDFDVSPFDLKQLVRSVISELERKETGREQQFQLTFCSEDHRDLLGSASQIHKLLSRFFDIASRLAADGSVQVSTMTELANSAIVQISLKAELVCSPDHELERLLSSSIQSVSAATGKRDETGLRIILCKKLAAMLGGSVGIKRHSDNRSTLWLTILTRTRPGNPVKSPLDERSSKPSSLEVKPRMADKTLDVLVAEDDIDMAMFIEDLLMEAGHRATVVHDGASVLRLLEQKHFDVVVLDGRMPDMSGIETAERIRQLPLEQHANLPIIALTGEALTGDRERYLSAGMNAYIPKPVNYDTLISTIKRYCS